MPRKLLVLAVLLPFALLWLPGCPVHTNDPSPPTPSPSTSKKPTSDDAVAVPNASVPAGVDAGAK